MKQIRLALIGAGATGRAHAAGALAAGGFKIAAVVDPIAERLTAAATQFKAETSAAAADEVFAKPDIDAVCLCVPTQHHAALATAALKAGKHVICECPPGPATKDANAIAKAAEKNQKIVLYSAVRRFGAAEQSARQAIEKGYVGRAYHARVSATRTRGVPHGTGWYHDPAQSGGGAIIDLGLPMLDLALDLMGKPKPARVFAIGHKPLLKLPVEEMGSALITLDNGGSIELTCAWAINQPPNQIGTTCRISGESGALDVYTPAGPVLYRGFEGKEPKAVALKQPKVAGHAAMFRHFRDCIAGTAQPAVGPAAGIAWMELAGAIYKSISTGKAVEM